MFLKKFHRLGILKMRKCAFLTVIVFLLTLEFINAQTLVFSPHWLPQAQFAGYYVAMEKGFYKEVGLDVKIIHPAASISAFDYLSTGKADIVSSFLMDGLKQRCLGVPLVNIAQFSQHSSLMMVAKKSSGITGIKDMHNKKLGIWSSGFEDIPIAAMRENSCKVQLVPVLNTVNLFLMDGIDVSTIMYYNEYDQIINSGINEDELNKFFFSEMGFDIPEDGLYCLERTLLSKKDALKKFTIATLKGWKYSAENREYAVDLVVNEMNKAHLPNNRVHQNWMLDKVLEMIEPKAKTVKKGYLLEQDYNKALTVIQKEGISARDKKDVKFVDFFKPLAD
jgi:NitT/TauT family transport system substrate-binding protein